MPCFARHDNFRCSFAQNEQTLIPISKNSEVLLNKNRLSPFNKPTIFKNLDKNPSTGLNAKSLICLDDSISGWQWDTLINGWYPNYKIIHIAYDAHNNEIENIVMGWNDSTWVNSSQNIYTYDAHNNQTSYISQGWNDTACVNSDKFTYAYDARRSD